MRLWDESIRFVRILGCGGCSLQHIHPDEQILLKQNVLKSHLQHFAGLQPEQWLIQSALKK
jgi:tRNA/tmRNA/rRNA uracil-C5-methylase (TrmA/RlmC/RlmD family)